MAECLLGGNYGRLVQVKKRYDPSGLVGCWKCVGFEEKKEKEKDGFGCWEAFERLV